MPRSVGREVSPLVPMNLAPLRIFKVAVASLSVVSYQWQFNGFNQAGATNASLAMDQVIAGTTVQSIITHITVQTVNRTGNINGRIAIGVLAAFGIQSVRVIATV